MSKVYVVINGDEECRGVFSTEELAQKYDTLVERCNITPCDLDDTTLIDLAEQGYIGWHVSIRRYPRKQALAFSPVKHPEVMMLGIVARTAEAAVDLAFRIQAQAIVDGWWGQNKRNIPLYIAKDKE